jgi:4'-phosphopantetheinyl transferase
MLRFCLPKDYSLPDDEVHIWQARLDSSRDRIEELREILSSDERREADRFHIDHDRKRYVLARGLLRLVIARLSNTSPELSKIVIAPHGKPYLLCGADQPRIEFNTSHSGEIIYVAIANSRAVGIDVEKVQDDFPFEMIARDTFSAVEFDALMALDPPLRRDGFFTCWARKEALFKANGKGLAAVADSCHVSLFGDLPMPTRLARFEEDAVANWTLLDLQTDPGYKAALVYEGTDCRVRRWDWPAAGV